MYPRGGLRSDAKYGVTLETKTPIARELCPENLRNEKGITPATWLYDGCISVTFLAVSTEMRAVNVVPFSRHFCRSHVTCAGPRENVRRLGVMVGRDEATGGPDQFLGSTGL